MYGGLFGDLPATKNSKNTDDKGADDSSSEAAAQAPSDAGPKQLKSADDDKTGSVVRNLGVAGTSMAFVPTAARQRQRSNKRPAPSSSRVSVSVDLSQTKLSSAPVITTISKSAAQEEIRDPSSLSTSAPLKQEQEPSGSSRNALRDQSQQENKEPEELRQLHEKALEDPYDPMVPNDLLQYWERKSMLVERERLERERQATLEEQERLRHQLEKEREELVKTGDVAKIVEHRTQHGLGRGRGRGVSNLPAWLIEKQKKES